jgi:hypothetical protein
VIVPILLAGITLAGASSTSVTAPEACDRRADIEAMRNADGAARAAAGDRL